MSNHSQSMFCLAAAVTKVNELHLVHPNSSGDIVGNTGGWSHMGSAV